ncbi:conserved protein of unknown function [Tenacibaculum sp. 190524A02b]|uniref:DUF6161 domain-containing protein n=1 Tax=Tenacibaculum vairaonense TaxID=3137860 RepID=UPI0032B226FF
MTDKEFRELISSLNQTTQDAILNNLDITLDLKTSPKEFSSIITLRDFLKNQINGFNTLFEKKPILKEHEYFQNCLENYFTLETELYSFINELKSIDIEKLDDKLILIRENFSDYETREHDRYVVYNIVNVFDTYIQRLIDLPDKIINNEFLESYISYSLFNKVQPIIRKDNLRAYITAESVSGHTISKPDESICSNKILKEFSDKMSKKTTEIEEHTVKHFSFVKDEAKRFKKHMYEKATESIDLIKKDMENYKSVFTDLSSQIDILEKKYDEKLSLSKPADYWKERGKEMMLRGYVMLCFLVVLILFTALFLVDLLYNIPDNVITSFFDNDKSAAIRWSIIFITLLSLIAYGVKIISKVMLSSFHIARDCEERHTLTYFYLSLIDNKEISSEEKLLVYQSLFSRAETGLLKDDSSPTMPLGDIFKKINIS